MSELNSSIERMSLKKQKNSYARARQAFERLWNKPIEPGWVVVMMLLERLSKEDPDKYKILHDWLIEKLGETYHDVHIASGYINSNDDEWEDPNVKCFYRARSRYLEVLGIHTEFWI